MAILSFGTRLAESLKAADLLAARGFTATVADARVELHDTDGSQGAARGAGVGSGVFPRLEDAFRGLATVKTVDPSRADSPAYAEAYERWKAELERSLAEG